MNDEIFFDGVQYTSAAFAAREVGRTRDYIARLCKEGKVAGKRVGKNWYVDLSKLKTYLADQEAVMSMRREQLSRERSRAYRAHKASEPLVAPQFINGEKYIAASDAARESGFSRDYIGRLCREKKVNGLFAGTIWYVDTNSLQDFLVTQEYEKSKRNEQLAQERAHEYRTQRIHALQNLEIRTQNLVRSPEASVNSFPSSVPQTPKPAPISYILTRVVTLALILTLTFGTYALVDPQGARESLRFAFTPKAEKTPAAVAPMAHASTSPMAPQVELLAAASEAGFLGTLMSRVGGAFAALFSPFAAKRAEDPGTVAVTLAPYPMERSVVNNTTYNTYNTNNTTNNNGGDTYYQTPDTTAFAPSGPASVVNNNYAYYRDYITNEVGEVDTTNLPYLAISGGTLTGLLNISASGTSTFAGGLSLGALDVSGSATSTFANGLNITDGCFAIDGFCVASGSGISAGGSNGQVQFNNGGSVDGAGDMFYDNATGYLGLGTTTPGARLSIDAQNGDSTLFNVASSSINIFSVGTGGITFTNATGNTVTTTNVSTTFSTSTHSTSTTIFTSAFGLGSGNYFTSLLGLGLENQSGVLTVNREQAFSTSSAAYFLSQNQSAAFSTTSASHFLSQNSTWNILGGYLTPTTTITTLFNNGFVSQASSTIVGLISSGSASTTHATISGTAWLTGLANALLSTDQNGRLVATSTIGLLGLNAQTAGFTNATTTNLDITGLLTFGGVTASSWSSFCSSITGSSDLCDGNDASGSAQVWPFTPSSYAGVANQSTTTNLWLNGTQLIASSTLAVNATTTGSQYFSSLVSSLLATDQNGRLVSTTSISTGYLTGTLGVDNGGTGASVFGQGWLFSNGGTDALAASTSPTVNYLTATSTSEASTIAYRLGIGGGAPTRPLDVTGAGRFTGTLTLSTLTNCVGAQALQTNGSGDISCGTLTASGASSAGGWTTNNIGLISLSTTTDLVSIGGSSTPYAKLTVLSGNAASTTLVLAAQAAQTANILDLYDSSGALSSVFTAAGFLGIGTTSPSTTFSVGGSGYLTGGLGIGVLNTAAGTLRTSGVAAFGGLGTFSSGFISNASSTISSGLFNMSGGASTTAFTNSGATWLTALPSALLATDHNGRVVSTTTISSGLLTGPLATINNTTITAGGTFTITAASSTLLSDINSWTGLNTFSRLTATNATTTNFHITGLTSALLGTDGNGRVVSTTSISTGLLTGSLGTINNTIFNRGDSITITAASSTLLADTNSWSGTNAFTGLTATNATTTNLHITGITSSLLATDQNGRVVSTTSISTGLLTGPLATINNTTITAGGTFTITAASSTLLSDINSWTGLNTFSRLTATNATTTGSQYFSSLTNAILSTDANGLLVSTTTIGLLGLNATNARFTNATTTNLHITGLTHALLGTDGNGRVVSTTSISTGFLVGTLAIAQGGTNASAFGNHMLVAFDGTRLVSSSTPTAARFFATSTTLASIFPLASTTQLSVSNTAFFPGSGIWNSSGAVGIGTTSPLAEFTVDGGTGSSVTLTGRYDGGLTFGDTRPALFMREDATGGIASFQIGGGDVYLGSVSANSLNFLSSNAVRMTIDAVGNVGVGNSAPATLFSNTSAAIGDADATAGHASALTWRVAGGGYAGALYNTIGNGLLIKTDDDTDFTRMLTLTANGVDQAVFLGNGALGLGTSTPTNRLEVVGTSFFAGNIIATGTIASTDLGTSTFAGGLNFTRFNITATSTGSRGINLTGGCFAINGSCLSLASLTGQIDLTTDVTGILPIANGGTNASSFTTTNNSVYYDGTRLVTSGTSQAVTTPYASSTALTVSGHCVTADTRLRRRRKNTRGEYEYDEPEIVDLEEGDEVQSLDEKTGQFVWSRVNRVIFMGVRETYRITTEDGRTIRTTAEHPYLVKDARGKWIRHRSPIAQAGWATVANLKEGDEIAVAEASSRSTETSVPTKKVALSSDLFQTPWTSRFDKPWTRYTPSVATSVWMSSEEGRGVGNRSLQPVAGVEPAAHRIPSPGRNQSTGFSKSYHEDSFTWAKIRSIEPVAGEDVYDVEIDGTHNFVGNGIVAHNTYLTGLSNSLLAVNASGQVIATSTMFSSSAFFTNATTTSLAITNLTSGRVPFVTTGGSLRDSSTFLYDNTLSRLTASNASTTALTVSGTAYFPSGIWNSSGNVGIGTTTPQALLSVGDNAVGNFGNLVTIGASMRSTDTVGVSIRSTNNNPLLQLCGGSSGSNCNYVGVSTTTGSLLLGGAASASDSVAKMFITTAGLVGIGSSTPGSTMRLTVGGNSFFGGNVIATGTLNILGAATLQSTLGISGAITSTATTFNTLPYASTTALTVSGTAFFPGSGIWNSSGNVGIGTTTPVDALEVIGDVIAFASGANSRFTSAGYGGGVISGGFITRGAQGTLSAPTATLLDDRLGVFGAQGHTGSTFSSARAYILMNAAEDWSGSEQGAYMSFFTTTAGSTATAERMRIDASGNIGIGTTTPQALLSVGDNAVGTFGNVVTLGVSQRSSDAVGISLRSLLTNPILQFCGGSATCNRIGHSTTTGALLVGGGGGLGTTDSAASMTITTAGLVGIGSSTPGSTMRLTVGGNAFFGGNVIATGTVTLSALTNSILSTNSTGQIVATSTIGLTNLTATNATTTSFAITNLTSGRVPFVTTGGSLRDSSSFTYTNASNLLTITNASTTLLSVAGTAYVENLRLIGASDPTTEIADIYVGSGGQLLLDTRSGTDSTAFIDIRGEDDQFGLILRDSSGAGTDWANFYMNNATTDYLNIVVNSANSTTGLVVDDNDRVGIGTTTPGSVGAAKLHLYGTTGSTAGPHVQFSTTEDAYPLLQILPYTHDNVSLNFDSYWDGSNWRSSDNDSNFQFRKASNTFILNYASSTAQGSAVTWASGLQMTNLGEMTITGDSVKSNAGYTNLLIDGDQTVGNTSSYISLNISPNFTGASSDTLTTFYGLQSNPVNSSSGLVTNMRGVYSVPQNSGGGEVTTMYGVVSTPQNTAGTTTTMYGVLAQPQTTVGATTTTMFGIYSIPGLTGTGAVTTMYGIHADPQPSVAASGTVTNQYGVFVRGGNASTAGAVVSNYYQLYLDTPLTTGAISGDFYGLFQEAASVRNYFAGQVGIGTSTPRWNLTIASSTGPQLALVDTTSSSNAWTFRSIANNFYLATSSPTATSSVAALMINSNGFLGIGTSSPGSKFAIQGIANFTYATSTFSSSGGLNIAGGCYAISNSCLSLSTITGILPVASGGTGAASLTGLLQGNGTGAITGVTGTAGQFPYYNGTNTLLATSTLFLTTSGMVGVGTTTAWDSTTRLQVSGSTVPRFVIDFTDNTSRSSILFTDSGVTRGFLQQVGSNFATANRQGAFELGTVTAHPLSLWTSGSERMRIDSSGNVGIGTTSPARPLDITSSAGGGTTLGLTNTDTGGEEWTLYSTGSGNTGGAGNFIIFNPTTPGGSSGNMRFILSGADGNAGFGTTTSPWAKLSVQQTGTVPAFVVEDQAADTSPFIIDAAGNVGIGTTTPQAKLEIGESTAGQLLQYITNVNTGTGSYAELSLRNDSSAFAGLRLVALGTGFTSSGAYQQDGAALIAASNLSGGLSIGTQASAPLRFYTAGAADANERMRITEAGLVGIGTTSPQSALHIAGTSAQLRLNVDGNNDGIYAVNDSTGNQSFTLTRQSIIPAFADLFVGSAGGVGFGTGITSIDTSGTDLYINSSGNVGIGTTTPVSKLYVLGNSSLPSLNSNTGIQVIRASTGVELAMGGHSSSPFGFWLQTKDNVNNVGSGTSYPLLLNPAGGNVGIGTTTPGALLHVSNSLNTDNVVFGALVGPVGASLLIEAANAQFNLAGNFAAGTYNAPTGTSSAKLLIGNYDNDGSTIYPIIAVDENGGTDFFIKNRPSINGASTAYFQGSVGIGTSTPVAGRPLNIYNTSDSSVLIQSDDTGASATDGFYLGISSGATDAYLWQYENNDLIFATNNLERLRIDPSGNVGIGSSTPGSTQRFAVGGDSFLGGNVIATGTLNLLGAATLQSTLGISGAITSTATTFNTLPYASSTALTVSGTTYLTGLTNALLGTDNTGKVVSTTSISTGLLTGILPIATGGTNASSFAATNGVVRYDGTRLMNASTFTFDGSSLTVQPGVTDVRVLDIGATQTINSVTAPVIDFTSVAVYNIAGSHTYANYSSTQRPTTDVTSLISQQNNFTVDDSGGLFGNVTSMIGYTITPVLAAGYGGTVTTAVGMNYGNASVTNGQLTNNISLLFASQSVASSSASIVVGDHTSTGNNATMVTGSSAIPTGDWDLYLGADYPSVLVSTSTAQNYNQKLVFQSPRVGIVAGDYLGGQAWWSHDTSLASPGIKVASIDAVANVAHTAAALGTDITFSTMSGTTFSEAMRITGGNNVGIGTTTPIKLLTVASAATPMIQTDFTTNTSYGGIKLSQGSPSDFAAGSTASYLLQVGNNFATPSRRGSVELQNYGGAVAFWTGNAIAERMRIDSSGNVGIGTTTPWKTLSVVGTAAINGLTASATGDVLCLAANHEITLDTTPGSGVCGNSASDQRLKDDIMPLSNGLDVLMQLKPVSFNWKNPGLHENAISTTGLIAQDLALVLPGLVGEDTCRAEECALVDGGNMLTININGPEFQAYLISAIQELGKKTIAFDGSHAPTSSPAVSVDVAGNVGIGAVASASSTFAYKLNVQGAVSATDFINVSKRDTKKDILTVQETEEDRILGEITATDLFTYHYKGEKSSAPERLGLITDSAPAEVLSRDGGGVDIYKLASFLFAGLKAEDRKVDALALRVTSLEAAMAELQSATSTSQVGAVGMAFDAVVDGLKALGTEIAQGFARFAYVIAHELAVGTPEKPTGITMYDKSTGAPYCFSIVEGAASTTPGVCTALDGIVANATSTPSTPSDSVSAPSSPMVVNTIGEHATTTEIVSDSSDSSDATSTPETLSDTLADAHSSGDAEEEDDAADSEAVAEDTLAEEGSEGQASEDEESTEKTAEAEEGSEGESGVEEASDVVADSLAPAPDET